jgi:hypothetical protein
MTLALQAAADTTRAAPQASAVAAPEAAAPPKPIFLKDYAPPPFTITEVHLDFSLGALRHASYPPAAALSAACAQARRRLW